LSAMNIVYLPIESYEERYTKQLRDWTLSAFQRHGHSVQVVDGNHYPGDGQIELPFPLDPYQRSRWATSQIEALAALWKDGVIQTDTAIYLQDMFHPGFAAIPYMAAMTDIKPRVFVQNCAGSMDVFDFTFNYRGWMRHYEKMVDESVAGVFVACGIHKELMLAADFRSHIFVTGLPFDSGEVQSRVRQKPWEERKHRVLFTSRFDREKNPVFFLEYVRAARASGKFDGVEFAISTSSRELKSNFPEALEKARLAQQSGALEIYEGLSKNEYYELLADSQVHFNCASQDFWSNTLNEAAAFGVPTIAPGYRCFPEAISNPYQLYKAFDIQDAQRQTERALLHGNSTEYQECMAEVVMLADQCLDKVIGVLERKINRVGIYDSPV